VQLQFFGSQYKYFGVKKKKIKCAAQIFCGSFDLSWHILAGVLPSFEGSFGVFLHTVVKFLKHSTKVSCIF